MEFSKSVDAATACFAQKRQLQFVMEPEAAHAHGRAVRQRYLIAAAGTRRQRRSERPDGGN